MISAAPTAWPHCELPAPRGRIGTPSLCGNARSRRAPLPALRGTTTPTGSTW